MTAFEAGRARVRVELDGHTRLWDHAVLDPERWVAAGADAFAFRPAELVVEGASAQANGALEAPMPGAVLAVRVKAGDEVILQVRLFGRTCGPTPTFPPTSIASSTRSSPAAVPRPPPSTPSAGSYFPATALAGCSIADPRSSSFLHWRRTGCTTTKPPGAGTITEIGRVEGREVRIICNDARASTARRSCPLRASRRSRRCSGRARPAARISRRCPTRS
jgi:hypothetical protein